MSTSSKGIMEKVAIIGSGLVGKSWAMIFASVGYKVTLYDIDPQQVQKALDNIKVELEQFEKDGVLRGNLKAAQQQPLISGSTDLEQSVKDVVYIQECVPENLALKKKVWAQVDDLIQDSQTILASSSSCIIPSQISEDLKHRDQFMVAHPVNPPYHAPMVELVPASWTRQDIRERSRAIMKEIGQVPVSLSREVPGFILNRMQYALLNECFRLILDGVVSADDLDVVMRDGLGLRYAFMGPMETIHLNALGLKKYCQTYGETISNVSKTMGEIPSAWLMQTDADKSQIENLHQQMLEQIPMDQHYQRCVRRDRNLAALAKLKRELQKQ
eukprot:06362.XXX_347668_348795_1 [CDS] Oithona nana genome sequencing.